MILLVAGCTWFWARNRLGPRLVPPGAPVVTRGQTWLFWSGLALLWIGASWPIHPVGEEYLLWVHMVQHELFSYLAPPLILLGLPPWMVRWLADLPILRQICRFGARPLVALVLFNTVSSALHARPVVAAATSNGFVHFAAHLALFTSAMCFWFPVVNPVDGLPRLRSGGRVLYLMVNTFLPILPVAFLGLATTPIYQHYVDAPRLRGWLNLQVVDDQHLAAGIMWTASSFWLSGAITLCFFAWWRREQRSGGANESLPEHIRRRVPAQPADGSG